MGSPPPRTHTCGALLSPRARFGCMGPSHGGNGCMEPPTKKTGCMGPFGNTGIWVPSRPQRLSGCVGPSQELVAWVPRAVRCGSLCARGRPRLDDVHVRGGQQALDGARTPSIVQVC